ncbi:MAG: transcriptional regulator [Candidatus Nealsonbacteria bacterium]|nr:MAG: transcriptional regulator [Candidatus Nealsonbacteria bacterium]
MAKEVIKKDGRREPFDPEKIKNSIRKAADGTDLSEERKNEVVQQVAQVVIQMAEEKEEIATSEIREKILSELDRVEPSVSAAWRKYDETKGETPETPEAPETPEGPADV